MAAQWTAVLVEPFSGDAIYHFLLTFLLLIDWTLEHGSLTACSVEKLHFDLQVKVHVKLENRIESSG